MKGDLSFEVRETFLGGRFKFFSKLMTDYYFFALSPSSLLLHFEPFLETADTDDTDDDDTDDDDDGDGCGCVYSSLDRFEVALLDEILKSKLSQLGNEGN